MKRADLIAGVRKLAAPHVEKLTDAVVELLVDHGLKAIEATRELAVAELRAQLEGKHASNDGLAAGETGRARVRRAKRRGVKRARVERPAVDARAGRREADDAREEDVEVKVERRASAGPTCGTCGEAGHNKRTCGRASQPEPQPEPETDEDDDQDDEEEEEGGDVVGLARGSTPGEVKPPPPIQQERTARRAQACRRRTRGASSGCRQGAREARSLLHSTPRPTGGRSTPTCRF